MDGERWIVVPRWNEFQHYKDRDPTWIKNYRRLVADDAYQDLSLAARGLLHGIWLLFSETAGVLSESVARRLLGGSAGDAKHFRGNLERLNHAGFIELSASKPLAIRYQPASPEKRRVKETRARAREAVDNSPAPARVEDLEPFAELPLRGSPVDPGKVKTSTDWECEICGLRRKTYHQLVEHLEHVHGQVPA